MLILLIVNKSESSLKGLAPLWKLSESSITSEDSSFFKPGGRLAFSKNYILDFLWYWFIKGE